MRFDRLYTRLDLDPFETIAYRRLMTDAGDTVTVPSDWGSVAVDVLVADIFYKQPLPAALRRISESGLPEFLFPSQTDPDADLDAQVFERDIRDVLHRVAGGLCHDAYRAGLFDDADAARVFYDELRYLMLHRMALPEIALLATVGLDWAYGVPPLHANYVPSERIAALPDHFAPRAIPADSVVVAHDTTLRDIATRLRLLADMRRLDAPDAPPLVATVPVEHIDSAALVAQGIRAEVDVVARDLGRRMLETATHQVMEACDRDSLRGFDPAYNGRLSRAIAEMRAAGTPETVLRRAIAYAQQGFENMDIFGRDPVPEAPVLTTVLSVPDDFIETALTGHGFMLVDEGRGVQHADAGALWDKIAEAVWSTGTPHLFFRDSAGDSDDTPAGAGSLAPSGVGGLVLTADVEAPAATLNLTMFTGADDALLQPEKFIGAVRIMMLAVEASYNAIRDASPATLSKRPVVLGYCGLSSVLMAAALPYDSDVGRTVAAQMTALLSGAAHLASAEMADTIGACDDYAAQSRDYLGAMRDKMAALSGARGAAKGVTRRPIALNPALSPDMALHDAVRDVWDKAYALGKEQGFRHAHVTGLATPLPLQGLLGASSRDAAPESGLIRFEGFSGDAHDSAALYGKKMNPAVPRGLKRLGYTAAQIDDIYSCAVGHGTLLDAPAINHKTLAAKGLTPEMIVAVEQALPAAQHITYAFNRWTLGDGMDDLPIGDAQDVLRALGFSEDDIDDANLYACGAMTVEGALHLNPDHLAIFDCVLPGGLGIRRVSAAAQIRMQAAVEPFLSGAVAQTLTLDHHMAMEDIQKLLLSGWELGVKRLSLWREGSSLLHPSSLLPQKWETSLFAEEEDAQRRDKRRKAATV